MVNAPTTAGLYDRDCFQVKANNVTIQGFRIVGAMDDRPGDHPAWGQNGRQNAGIMVGNDPSRTLMDDGTSYFGISGCTFSHNEIVDCSKGLFLFHAKNCEVSYNTITTTEGQIPDNFYDILGWNGDGVMVYLESAHDYPTGNTISHNTMTNTRDGVILTGHPIGGTTASAWDFRGTTIEDNTITNVWNQGVMVQMASGTAGASSPITIKDNTIDTSTGRRAGDECNERGLISVKGDYTEITSNTVTNSEEHGMWIDGSHHTITGNTVTSNTKDGIHIGPYKQVEPCQGWTLPNPITKTDIDIHCNNIYGNTGSPDYGLDGTDADEVVDAENNWWGHASGPTHAGNPGGSGDAVSDNVDYDPWWVEKDGTNTEETESETISGSGTMENTPTGGDVSIDATGDHTITTAKYAENPGGTPTFQASGNYYDVHLDDETGVNSLTVEFCPADENMVIYYWNGTSWLAASAQEYDEASGCIVVTITEDTHPSLEDLTGLPFASGTPAPVGGEAYPVNKLAILMPWIALGIAVIAGATVFMRRRRSVRLLR